MSLMDEARFWKIIEATRELVTQHREEGEDFAELHMAALQGALGKLSPQDLLEFDARYHELSTRAYRWDVWGAAYWEGGGCSDDGFMDFRSCLISLGREWYERILKNPDDLAETIGRKDLPYMQSEGFLYLAPQLYRERTGRELPDSGIRHPAEPAGERFDFDDPVVMRKHYPKLLAKMPSAGNRED